MSKTDDLQHDRIREYLRQLTPQARRSLLTEIERMQLYGDDVAGSAVILAALRTEFRQSGESGDRIGNPSRYFYKPIEELFVDRPPERTNAGEISRGSLSAIWQWINQILLPTMARDYCEEIKRAIMAKDARAATHLAGGFQAKVVKCLEGFVASEDGVEAARNGLGRYISSHASVEDLKKVLAALQIRDAIVSLGKELPPAVDNLRGKTLAKVRAVLDAFAVKHPHAVPFALTILMKRLKTPWQLIRLATDGAPGKTASDLAATRYGFAFSTVLGRLDENRMMFRYAVKNSRVATARDILSGIYDIEDALRDGIDGLDESEWGARLNELMAAVSADLKNELRSLPQDTHHVLGSLHRRRLGPGLLGSLVRKGRDLVSFG